jgi:hypothetical protein
MIWRTDIRLSKRLMTVITETSNSLATQYILNNSLSKDISAYDKDIAEADTERIKLEAKLEGVLYP